MLLNGNISVPHFNSKASWNDFRKLHDIENEQTLKIIPRVSRNYIHDLKFASKMKVKLACQVISNSCAAAFDCCVVQQKIEGAAAATSTYCKKINDLFYVLNSFSPKDKVPLRRSISSNSDSLTFLNDSLKWLEELQSLNIKRRCSFGFIRWMSYFN